MTLDEAIKHAEAVAKEKRFKAHDLKQCKDYGNPKSTITSGVVKCEACADEHHQLAEWLKDYKRIKEREPLLEKIKEKYALMKADERKKGKWINKSHTIGCGIKFAVSECTCCGKKTFFDCDQLVYNYCPNCGAKMEG